ncbi:MAG TPA: hypothetical protein VHW23_38175, partial [Kofleriaceae bacterium]|nr:hypothetical protein [Kofleriaceae bacterium]
LDVFLPQKLVDLEREQQQEGGPTQKTLDAVREYLKTFDDIAGGIQGDILELQKNGEIPARPQKESGRGKTKDEQKAAEQRHKQALRAHELEAGQLGPQFAQDRADSYEGFMTAGDGSTAELSKKLVLATAAAKRFTKPGELGKILRMCRAASTAVAEFLAEFYPQGVATSASVAATAQPAASSSAATSSTPHAPSPSAMQVDSP